MHDWTVLGGVFLNIIVTLGGFVKIAVSYEHRFTKIETELLFLMRKLEGLEGDKK